MWHVGCLHGWATVKTGSSGCGGLALPQHTTWLARRCLHAPAWELAAHTGTLDFSCGWGVCTLPVSSVMDALPRWLGGLSLLWPLHWRDYIGIKYWNWQVLDNFRRGFLHFPDIPLSRRWVGVICFTSWQRIAFIHWCIYFLICGGSHLVREARHRNLICVFFWEIFQLRFRSEITSEYSG